MLITTDKLRELGACSEGINLFEDYFKDGTDDIDAVILKAVKINYTDGAEWIWKRRGCLKRVYDFKSGDIVRVRHWDDMLAEFDSLGPIHDKNRIIDSLDGFNPGSGYLCGRLGTIDHTEDGYACVIIDDSPYDFSIDEIEKVDIMACDAVNRPIYVGETVRIFNDSGKEEGVAPIEAALEILQYRTIGILKIE